MVEKKVSVNPKTKDEETKDLISILHLQWSINPK